MENQDQQRISQLEARVASLERRLIVIMAALEAFEAAFTTHQHTTAVKPDRTWLWSTHAKRHCLHLGKTPEDFKAARQALTSQMEAALAGAKKTTKGVAALAKKPTRGVLDSSLANKQLAAKLATLVQVEERLFGH